MCIKQYRKGNKRKGKEVSADRSVAWEHHSFVYPTKGTISVQAHPGCPQSHLISTISCSAESRQWSLQYEASPVVGQLQISCSHLPSSAIILTSMRFGDDSRQRKGCPNFPDSINSYGFLADAALTGVVFG